MPGGTAGSTVQQRRRCSLGDNRAKLPEVVLDEGPGHGMAAGEETGPPAGGSKGTADQLGRLMQPRGSLSSSGSKAGGTVQPGSAEQLARLMSQRDSAAVSLHSLSSSSKNGGGEYQCAQYQCAQRMKNGGSDNSDKLPKITVRKG
eukprot:gene30118-35094_t